MLFVSLLTQKNGEKKSMGFQNFKSFRNYLSFLVIFFLFYHQANAKNNTPAFSINGKTVTIEDLEKKNQGAFYDLKKSMYTKIEQYAQEAYLEKYFEEEAKKKNKNKEVTSKVIEETRDNYFKERVKITKEEVEETWKTLKEHPSLKKMSEVQQKEQVKDLLKARASSTLLEDILAKARSQKSFVIDYPYPVEPKFNIDYVQTDQVRYGPSPSDTTPASGHCKVGSCPITVYEFSEFQCPFCNRVQGTIKQLLTKYKGKVAWIFRDFPLGFHDRAKPAAIAALCAGKQGKFWHMYQKLFENQRQLGDADFLKHVTSEDMKLDKEKFEKCIKDPAIAAVVQENFLSGQAVGVNGTPAFFVNGRRLSGAVPYAEFERIFEDELQSIKTAKNNKTTKSNG